MVAILIHDLFLLAGTAYLIHAHGWSPWWFLFAVFNAYSIKTKKGGDE